jgi:hypothetical protein
VTGVQTCALPISHLLRNCVINNICTNFTPEIGVYSSLLN